MDPRVQAILKQYEEEERKEELKHKPTTPEPPKSFEQWLERRPTGLKEWPDAVDFGKEFSISVASVGLGSLEDIMGDLAQHARILELISLNFNFVAVSLNSTLSIQPSQQQMPDNDVVCHISLKLKL